MNHYIYAEDLAAALVGPFPDAEAARAHVAFLDDRGDGAETEILTEAQAAGHLADATLTKLTPEEDRAWRPPQ